MHSVHKLYVYTYSGLIKQKTYLLSLTNLKWRYNLFLLANHPVSAIHDVIQIPLKKIYVYFRSISVMSKEPYGGPIR